ncbi:hypothetical protein [Tsukamurella soli]|uniref:Uncharacterized protein n=1 Tax=Tsukamurella soli TaxID=644556 RepID=A0ABP8J2S2_9ACTN
MRCDQAVDALASAGVVLTPYVADYCGGAPEVAFTDALALADDQQIVLAGELVAELRMIADRLYGRFDAAVVAPIYEALDRIDRRAQAHSAVA